MSIRNALLCGLVGHPAGTDAALDWPGIEARQDLLLFAMHLVASDRLSEVAQLCRGRRDLDVASLSHYCLFLGLTRNVSLALRAFDVLKSAASGEGGVWLDLAYLQAVCRQPTAAARSIAVHAVLTGREPPKPDLPAAVAEDAEPGSIRFMPGDVAMPLPEEDED